MTLRFQRHEPSLPLPPHSAAPEDEEDIDLVEPTATTGTIPSAQEIPVVRLVVTGFVLTLVVVLLLRVGSQVIDRDPPPPPPVPTQNVHIRAIEPVHLKIVVDGETVMDGRMAGNKSVDFTGHDRIEVDASDLSGLTIFHDQQRVEPLHNLSGPRRLVFIQ